jgi:hypothetical protein
MITAATIFKLAIPAVQKAGSLIFQKLSRLRRIDDAINLVVDDELAKTAVSDFEIVKGTWRGEFDVTVDGFLRAFEASGLNHAMFNNALANPNSPALKGTFVALFQKETGQGRENGELLYGQIARSFEITAQYLTKDPVLARMIRASHQDMLAALTTVEAAVESIKLGIANRPSAEEVLEVIPRILRAVSGDTRYIRVETSQGRKDIEIGKIYI